MTKENAKVIGYKAFSSEWTCRGFKYEVGKTYKTTKSISVCDHGFHFCEHPTDVLNYYGNVFQQKYAVIEASGKIKKDGDKSCCSK